jgi:glutathione S-transferase
MLAASRLITLRPPLPSRRRFFQTTAGAASDVVRPFLLYTSGTPNGRKASVFLEELRAAYGVDYE